MASIVPPALFTTVSDPPLPTISWPPVALTNPEFVKVNPALSAP